MFPGDHVIDFKGEEAVILIQLAVFAAILEKKRKKKLSGGKEICPIEYRGDLVFADFVHSLA